MTTLTVSVLMPVFNAGRYVAQAVESILAQTYTDFELSIVDDGSTDGSLAILQRYAARDPRIHLKSRGNRGIAATRNELLFSAAGTLVAPMDADDVALPHRLARQVEFLRDHPDVVCTGASYRIIDGAGRLIHRGFPVVERDEEIQRLMLKGHCAIHQPTVMFRRDAAVRVGGYDPSFRVADDLDLWLRLGELGALANMPEPVVDYRVHATSITYTLQETALSEIRAICERAWQRRGVSDVVEVEPWRPTHTARSRHEYFLRYGWWAFNCSEPSTAALYAIRAIRELPHRTEGWKLLACAFLKRPDASALRTDAAGRASPPR
jgi:glycosyltransferase involved in cell wall biosynthesis